VNETPEDDVGIRVIVVLAIIVLTFAAWLWFFVRPVQACEAYPVGPNSPTGCVNDVAYGVGKASTWGGPGVARNDCTYPWTACTPIQITSLSTGLSIVVTPTMYCDCWRGLKPGETGPNGERPRLVDLDPLSVVALGLPGPGLWDVRVEPVNTATVMLPNTAMER